MAASQRISGLSSYPILIGVGLLAKTSSVPLGAGVTSLQEAGKRPLRGVLPGLSKGYVAAHRGEVRPSATMDGAI
jgi:hypothetical protein